MGYYHNASPVPEMLWTAPFAGRVMLNTLWDSLSSAFRHHAYLVLH
jgi:hypothetical protein